MSDDDAKKKVKTAKKKKEKETKRTANKIFDRFAALPREYKCAFFIVLKFIFFKPTPLFETFSRKSPL